MSIAECLIEFQALSKPNSREQSKPKGGGANTCESTPREKSIQESCRQGEGATQVLPWQWATCGIRVHNEGQACSSHHG